MRRWQVAKLREAGLDPYMRGTWQEAQAAMAALDVKGAKESKSTQKSAETFALVPLWPPASDRTCPHCGRVLSRVMHLKRHLNTCPERPRPEAT
jgi:hypothetical protein